MGSGWWCPWPKMMTGPTICVKVTCVAHRLDRVARSNHGPRSIDHRGETPVGPHVNATGFRRVSSADSLLPNTDAVDQTTFTPSATEATQITVANGGRFRAGDQVKGAGSAEVMLVTGVSGEVITVVRGYGGTTPEALEDAQALSILGNAALEGADRPEARFTTRTRRSNFCQIFTAGVEVSGSQQAAQTIGVADELDYQKQERLRELLRDLENCVINGVAAQTDPQGSSTVRRTMNGILAQVQTHRYVPGLGEVPPGEGLNETGLNEAVLKWVMRRIWEGSSGSVDTIVVGGAQKRRINSFIGQRRGFLSSETVFRDLVSVYASDFGAARVVMSRWVPADTLILLDSSRIETLPLRGRSFHFRPTATTGDAEAGQVIGEYTLELRNEAAHGVITGLAID